ncbi:MAG: hypothetical protein EOO88_51295, partial [Pedobacter sp.]
MKQFLLCAISLFLVMGAAAQPASHHQPLRYYFGSNPIALTQSDSKIYVRLSMEKTASTKNMLRNRYNISTKELTTLQAENFFVIDLTKTASSSRSKEIMDALKSNNDVQIARPVLVAPDGKEVIIDEGFYVKLKTSVSYAQLANLSAQKNCVIEKAYPYNNKTWLLKAGAVNHYDGLKMANEFFETGLFEYAEPDFRLLDPLTAVPNDPLFNLQWAAINTGAANQGSGFAGADIDLDEAWDITMG